MSSDFKAKYQNYKNMLSLSPRRTTLRYKFLQGFNLPNSITTQDQEIYILTSLLELFDSDSDKSNTIFITPNNKTAYNGQIEESEFKQVSKEEYNKRVQEIEQYCKDMTGEKELKYHIPTYNELEQMLKNDKFGLKEITIDELMEPICPNGKIGQINQKSYGECYQDAANLALSNTPAGRALLRRSIQIGPYGYTVTLFGTKDKNGKPIKYKISYSELKQAQEQNITKKSLKEAGQYKQYTTGDADVVLFDLAIKKYRESINYIALDKHKATGNGDIPDYLSAGDPGSAMEWITGRKRQAKFFKTKTTVVSATTPNQTKTTELKNTNITEIETYLKKAMKTSIGITTIFKSNESIKKHGLYTNHAYAISYVDFDNGYVYLMNPHNTSATSSNKTRISLDFFLEYTGYIAYV